MREFIDGNTAIVRGALAAGCDFFAGYPITPATPILLAMMRELPRAGGIAIQGEDEIASLGFCIGAAMTGRRTFTATSGPGGRAAHGSSNRRGDDGSSGRRAVYPMVHVRWFSRHRPLPGDGGRLLHAHFPRL